MKIAILVTGQTRFDEHCLNNFMENVIAANKDHLIDVYAHNWLDSSQDQTSIFAKYNVKKYILEQQKYFNIEKFKHLDPTIHNTNNIHGSKQCYCDLDMSKYNIFTTHSSYYSLMQCFELAKNNDIEYDLFIRFRFDIYLSNKINFGNDLFAKCVSGYYPIIGDQEFLVANYQNMCEYVKIYEDLNYHYKDYVKHLYIIINESMSSRIKNYNSSHRCRLSDHVKHIFSSKKYGFRKNSEHDYISMCNSKI